MQICNWGQLVCKGCLSDLIDCATVIGLLDVTKVKSNQFDCKVTVQSGTPCHRRHGHLFTLILIIFTLISLTWSLNILIKKRLVFEPVQIGN